MSSIRRALNSVGFIERELDTINHYPAYLMFSPILFRLGILYERITSLNLFRSLRGSILCVFEKREMHTMTASTKMSQEAKPLASAAIQVP